MKINPIFHRESITELKEDWLFSFDKEAWQPINVPFCPESELSGIGYKGFIRECFYKKKFRVDKTENRIMLHFGAVDYRAIVCVNDKYVGMHIGGHTPFAFDITNFVDAEKESELFVWVLDNEYGHAPTGKQSFKENSFGCFYTRVTGIWQPVWLEYIPQNAIRNVFFYPSIENCSVDVDLLVEKVGKYSVEVFYDNQLVGKEEGEIEYRKRITISLSQKHLWELGNGRLYDVVLRYENDIVHSYFGLREVRFDGYKFLLNGKETFQKLVLDQGYYPSGIYTAPSVEDMQKDIDCALELGFNGARLHQKVFDPRFLYLCDKAGYMVWGEFPGWGIDYSDTSEIGNLLAQWEEVLSRDFNHPSIITWCPLNETWGDWGDPRKKRDVKCVDIVYDFTKRLDCTRPVVDVSGGHHGRATDLFDFHCYESIEALKKYLDDLQELDKLDVSLLYADGEPHDYPKGLPVQISEFGGIALATDVGANKTETINEGAVQSEENWGYGNSLNNADELVEKYGELVSLISKYDKISGFCYTQLYDVEQEKNGFYTYERADKLNKSQKENIRKFNALFDKMNT